MSEATVPCRGCSFALPAGAARCDRCGAVQSTTVVCPHCRANADASPDRELRYACDVCGGPRVPFAGDVTPSETTKTALADAQTSRVARVRSRGAALAASILLPFVIAIAVLLGLATHAPLAALLLGVIGTVGLVSVDVLAFRRAKEHGAALAGALDRAWISAAADVARAAGGSISAEGLARALRIRTSQAEELLALLEASEIVQAHVTAEGETAYRARFAVDEAAEADEHAAGDDEHAAEIESAAAIEADRDAAEALASREPTGD